VTYLEYKLQVNLRTPSDAATYMDNICKMLEQEGSGSLLQKIELQYKPMTWECRNCRFPSIDGRKYPTAYCLTISDSANRDWNITSALQYTRSKKCMHCNREAEHLGKKEFIDYPKHLVVVPQNPKVMKLQINDDDRFEFGEKFYSLIGSAMHYGSEYFHLGHYIALVKDHHKWYECNDSHVHEISTSKKRAAI
jgi:hypothetical protein